MQTLSDYKRQERSYLHSFFSKMLPSALLVLVLSSTTVLTDGLSESCGCAIEEVESFNEGRIPSMIRETYCHQPGSSCIGHFKVHIVL